MGVSSSACSPSVNMSSNNRHPASERDRKQFPVKLDHEGVTSPKTKNGKALQRLGGKGDTSPASAGAPLRYTHPAMVVKDGKKSGGEKDITGVRSEGVSKGSPPLRKDLLAAGLGVQEGDLDYQSDGPSSYSELDEEDEDEGQDAEAPRRSTGDASQRGSRFLSRLSACFSSSSSSSSSSGSISSSSLCSSENDSSYSSDEESSAVLLRRALLQQDKHKHRQNVTSDLLNPDSAPSSSSPPAPYRAKGSISGSKVRSEDRKELMSKGGLVANSSTAKAQLKRKDRGSSSHHQRQSSPGSQLQKSSSKDPAKRQRMSSPEPLPSLAPLLPGRQLWKWSGNPTQVRHVGLCPIQIKAELKSTRFWGPLRTRKVKREFTRVHSGENRHTKWIPDFSITLVVQLRNHVNNLSLHNLSRLLLFQSAESYLDDIQYMQ